MNCVVSWLSMMAPVGLHSCGEINIAVYIVPLQVSMVGKSGIAPSLVLVRGIWFQKKICCKPTFPHNRYHMGVATQRRYVQTYPLSYGGLWWKTKNPKWREKNPKNGEWEEGGRQ